MELHLKIIGFILITLALLHIIFPKYFDWKNDLSTLSLINRQMMHIHTFFIAFTVFLMGLLCISSSTELSETVLGHKISLWLGIFWITRLFIQFFWYSPKLWKGKKIETTIHILFSFLWSYVSAVFFYIYFTNKIS